MRALLLAVLLAACNSGSTRTEPEADEVEKRDTDPKQAATVSMAPEAIKAAGVTIEPVAETEVVATQDLPGTIEAQNGALVIVNNRAAGVIESIKFDIGDRVKAGQQLATIRSLELAQAQATYRKAVVAEKYAAAVLERSEGLEKDGVISQKRLEADKQQARESKLAIEEAGKRIRIIGGSTGDTSGVFTVASPIAGVIAARKANRGESVAANSPLFTIVDATRIFVQLKALGGTQVVPGTKVTFTVDAFPERVFEARVKSSSDLIDPETRRFFIICTVDNSDGVLKPGMFITGHLPGRAIRALTVPEAAIQIIEGKPSVFVERAAGQFERREVTLGTKADERVAVETGLAAGEKVVARGSFMVRTQMQKSELEE